MAKAKKMSYEQIKVELSRLSAESNRVYGSYSYAAGFLESMLAYVLADSTVNQQNCEMDTVARVIKSLKAR